MDRNRLQKKRISEIKLEGCQISQSEAEVSPPSCRWAQPRKFQRSKNKRKQGNSFSAAKRMSSLNLPVLEQQEVEKISQTPKANSERLQTEGSVLQNMFALFPTLLKESKRKAEAKRSSYCLEIKPLPKRGNSIALSHRESSSVSSIQEWLAKRKESPLRLKPVRNYPSSRLENPPKAGSYLCSSPKFTELRLRQELDRALLQLREERPEFQPLISSMHSSNYEEKISFLQKQLARAELKKQERNDRVKILNLSGCKKVIHSAAK